MKCVKIALVGAGSRSFGPATVRDVLLRVTRSPRSAWS